MYTAGILVSIYPILLLIMDWELFTKPGPIIALAISAGYLFLGSRATRAAS